MNLPATVREAILCLVCGLATLWISGCNSQPPASPSPATKLGTPGKIEDSSNTMPPVQQPEPTPEPTPEKAPTDPPPEKTGAPDDKPAAANPWKSLFDGKTLAGWKSIEFGGEGEVTVENEKIVMQRGSDITGIVYTGDELPKVNYEIAFEAQRLDGLDFFSGLVFPYKDSFCSFVVGGWGGGTVGLSSVDGVYANDNSTGSHEVFKQEQWYQLRLRVGDNFVRAWIDNKNVVDLDMTGHMLSVHPAVDLAKPLGITCYATISGLRNIYIRTLSTEEADGKETPAPPFPKAAVLPQ